MLTHSTSNLPTVEAHAKFFILRYRCLECGELVTGTRHAQGELACEQCQSPLDEDDEVAQPTSSSSWEDA